MSLQAKFVVQMVQPSAFGDRVDVALSPSMDATDMMGKDIWSGTPAGSFMLTLTNPTAYPSFTLGSVITITFDPPAAPAS